MMFRALVITTLVSAAAFAQVSLDNAFATRYVSNLHLGDSVVNNHKHRRPRRRWTNSCCSRPPSPQLIQYHQAQDSGWRSRCQILLAGARRIWNRLITPRRIRVNRSRTGTVALAPSGIVFTPASVGPPDEAQVVRKNPPEGTYQFTANLSKPT